MPVVYVPFPDEGHGLRNGSSIIHALETELAFYSKLFGFRPYDEIEPLAIENLSE